MSGLSIPRILTIANQKGGVGKTTTAINLATALAAIGETVCLVDLDPQGNASTGLGISREERKKSTYDLLTGESSLEEICIPTAVPRLSVAPSTMDLLGLELEISLEKDRIFRLKNALSEYAQRGNISQNHQKQDRFSYILIDCPPSLNLLTLNSMAAAQAVIVPLQCEFFALEGLSQLLQTVEQMREAVNPELEIHGIVLTMYDGRNNLANQVVSDVRDVMGDKVYSTVIPRNVRISEAPSHGKPALLYDMHCSGSQAYLQLASEVIQREKKLKAA